MKTTLLIPTLNEVEGMKIIMPRVKKEWIDQCIIADGGSTDGTVELAKEMGYEVVPQKTPGIIYAQRDAFPSIIGDIIISFSPDGNCIPELIPELIAKMKEGYDMVIMSRYLNGLRSEDDSRSSRIGNQVITKLINLAFGGTYTDTLSIFRGYRTQAIVELGLLHDRKLSIAPLVARHYCWDLMSSIRMAKASYKVLEIPGLEPKRVGGVGKCRHFTAGFATLALIANEFLVWNVQPSQLTASEQA